MRGRFEHQTFASFDLREGEGECTLTIRNAYRAARQFAEKPSGWLVLYGSRGTGKSHLGAAIANHLLHDGQRWPVMFITAPDLLDLLRSGYQSGDYDDLLELCCSIDVLILDDLGVETSKNWVVEKLFQIFNRRYMATLPTVVISNCRPQELEPRLYDRLSDDDLSVRVAVVGPSYRQRRSAPGTVV